MRNVGRVDDEGKGEAAMFEGKELERNADTEKWRADDLERKEIANVREQS